MRTGKGGVYPFTLWYKSPGGLDSLCGGTVDVHIEYLKPRPHILICGGGHVGKALADMSVPVEYYHSIYDVRSEYASLSRFPHAREHHHGDVASFARSLDPRAYSHLVVCGHSYHVDLEILEKMLPVFGGWVGVIASAAKKREMFRALEERGLAAAQLARVECPIGLSIGATTPAEIAVSILGSIIREQNTDAREPRNPA
jgi:xanthine dehydrogenase accessory factor